MNYKEIKEALSALEEMECFLAEEYESNGGEITESTEFQEQQIGAIKYLLENEGVDSLGRWRKSKEDLIATLEVEVHSLVRRIGAEKQSLDFIDSTINMVLDRLELDKTKGLLYGFKRKIYTNTEVDRQMVKALYYDKVKAAMEKAGIPKDITVSLGASVSALEAGEELPSYYIRSSREKASFIKPRKCKKDEDE